MGRALRASFAMRLRCRRLLPLAPPPPQRVGDRELICFEDLYHDPRIARLVRNKAYILARCDGFSRSDREDFEQEFWLGLWLAGGRFDPARGDLMAWAATVVERAAGKLLRARMALKRKGPLHSIDDPAAGLHADNPLFAGEDASLLSVDRGEDLAELLAELPEEQRTLAVGLRTDCLAGVGRSTGVSRSRLRRLVAKLRLVFESAEFRNYLRPRTAIAHAKREVK